MPQILSVGPVTLRISKPYKKLTHHILTAARGLIALNWKNRSPPTPEALYARIKDVELMERMIARIQDRLEAHDVVWEPWRLREDPS